MTFVSLKIVSALRQMMHVISFIKMYVPNDYSVCGLSLSCVQTFKSNLDVCTVFSVIINY